MLKKNTRFITQAALIGALYTAVNLVMVLTPLGQLAFGPIQLRVSEALTVLPLLTPAAIPGLFVGCVLSNLLGMAFGLGGGVWDVVFGSIATLLAAIVTYRMRNYKWLAMLAPVVFNALIVGVVLYYTFMNTESAASLWMMMATVGAGQAIVCYALGMPLYMLLSKVMFGRVFERSGNN